MNNPFLNGMNAGEVWQYISRAKRNGEYTPQMEAWESEFYKLDSSTAPDAAQPALRQARAKHIKDASFENTISSISDDSVWTNNNALSAIEEFTPDDELGLSQLLADLQGENPNASFDYGNSYIDQAVTDGNNYLTEEYDAFKRRGLPTRYAAEFERLDDMPNLPKGAKVVPQEYRRKYTGGGETRIGTEFRRNSVTGTNTVIPSIDVSVPKHKKPIGVFFGTQAEANRVRNSRQGGKIEQGFAADMLTTPNPDEYVQRQLMRRRGENVEFYNTSGNDTVTDFISSPSGELVDGEQFRAQRGASSPNPQAITWVEPSYTRGQPISTRMTEVRRVVKDSIKDNPNISFDQIIQDASLEGRNAGSDPLAGKLFGKGDWRKDRIFYPEYPPSNIKRVGSDEAAPPIGAWEDDVSKAKKELGKLRGKELENAIEVKPSGRRYTNYQRPQIDINFPERVESKFRTNPEQMLINSPEMKQFMDYQQSPALTPIPMDELEARGKPKGKPQTTKTPFQTQSINRETARRTRTRSSTIPKGEVGGVNAGLLDEAGKRIVNTAKEGIKEGIKGGIKGRIGGLTNAAFNGASREVGLAIGQGDAKGASIEFAKAYGIGAMADLGLRKAGEQIIKRLPATLTKAAASTVGSGGWAAPMAAAYTVYDLADGAVEGFTGKGIRQREEEAADAAVTRAYERKWNQPAPRGGFVPKDKPRPKAKPERKPISLENINKANEALQGLAPEAEVRPATITKATPQVDKPDAGNFVSQWTNKVRSWFK